jgi:hypothetical protein
MTIHQLQSLDAAVYVTNLVKVCIYIFFDFVLSDAMVSVFATGPKVRGFKPVHGTR